MLADQAAMDAIAQNLANASTVGYKRDLPQFQSFQATLLSRMTEGGGDAALGALGSGGGVHALATDFADGALQPTGNPLDVALSGQACLAVQTPQGVRYTRDGALTRSAQGQLVQANGGSPVLDQAGRPISIPARARDITISPAGDIRADGVSVGRLQLAAVGPGTGAVKQGDSLFVQANAAPAGPDVTVHQGFLEASNVNIVQEMVAMIAVQRAYETDQKMSQTEDDATNKAVNDAPKM